MKYEEKVHETPHGGVKSRVYYQDADGLPVEKKDAVQVRVDELDGDDRPVFRTYARIS